MVFDMLMIFMQVGLKTLLPPPESHKKMVTFIGFCCCFARIASEMLLISSSSSNNIIPFDKAPLLIWYLNACFPEHSKHPDDQWHLLHMPMPPDALRTLICAYSDSISFLKYWLPDASASWAAWYALLSWSLIFLTASSALCVFFSCCSLIFSVFFSCSCFSWRSLSRSDKICLCNFSYLIFHCFWLSSGHPVDAGPWSFLAAACSI